MTQKKRTVVKRIPQRTCIACRKVEGKKGLIRIIRGTNGVEVDPTGKKAGRGAYLCANNRCWQIALRTNRIEQALRTKITIDERNQLQEYASHLPEADDEEAVLSAANR